MRSRRMASPSPQRAVYKKESAERHWERLFAVFHRRLE